MGSHPRLWLSLALCASLLFGVVTEVYAIKPTPGFTYNLSEYQKMTGKAITKFTEPPELAALVSRGKLPSVEERLPDEPAVVEPFEKIGKYGGTWRRGYVSAVSSTGIWDRVQWEPLVRWNNEFTALVPGVARGWKVSTDRKEYTFYLRPGMKWSDGKPFTADDYLFWWQAIIQDDDLTPVKPKWLTSGGELAKFEKIDTYTIKFTFKEPYPLFLEQLAHLYGTGSVLAAPKHYLAQFHPRYTSKQKLDQLVKSKGFDTWWHLFGDISNPIKNPDCPVIFPWMITEVGTTRLVGKRNPYYWKIDPNGKQLPYIDTIIEDLLGSSEVVVMRALAGEYDMQMRWLDQEYVLLMENRQKGGYRLQGTNLLYSASAPCLFLNQTAKDPAQRQLFQDKRFRRALSLAINREEMAALIYPPGVSKPVGYGPPPSVPGYEKFRQMNIEYDPAEANRILDEMGLTKGKDGIRVRPDGKKVAITAEIRAGEIPTTDIASIIQRYFRAIGVDLAVKADAGELFWARGRAGEPEAVIFWGVNTDLFGGYMYTFPVSTSEGWWAPQWARWYESGGKAGEEPPQIIGRLQSLYDEARRTVDTKKRTDLLLEAYKIHSENQWIITTIERMPITYLIKNTMKNVPRIIIENGAGPGNANFEQFFFEE